MFNEPEEDPAEVALDPAGRAKEKSDELRMHAELAAVFEGPRKFDAQIEAGLNPDTAREIQRTMARLEKAKIPETPVIAEGSMDAALAILRMPTTSHLTTNDYHIYRRPGEVMMVRWLEGEQVETYYERIQAHFDAALEGFREDEKQANEWKQDPAALAYLTALDALDVKIADRYLRKEIRDHHLFVLSTQTADEINIAYICDHIMGVNAAEVVGKKSAPPEEPTEQDLAWFFKLFSLRGIDEGVERMCFFTYLQKSDDVFSDD
ncbi:MAG TPA: hypothetical protein VIM11_11160 [Tepidisphaeraceae bacterium]|jgi:hypothetical protein